MMKQIDSVYYDNWYVLFVKTGNEDFIKSVIERYADCPIELLIFYREILNKREGKIFSITSVLFDSYIFVHEKVMECMKIVKKYLTTEFVHPLSINNVPCKVNKAEMRFLLECTNNQGIFRLSKAFKKDNQIRIVDGPLKKLTGDILWIDEKKQKAKVQIFLFNKKMEVTLGLNLIDNIQKTAC